MTRTYNAYLEIVPDLTAKDKEVIKARLLLAREAAMLTDADKEIVAIYKRHKVKVEQYVGAQEWLSSTRRMPSAAVAGRQKGVGQGRSARIIPCRTPFSAGNPRKCRADCRATAGFRGPTAGGRRGCRGRACDRPTTAAVTGGLSGLGARRVPCRTAP